MPAWVPKMTRESLIAECRAVRTGSREGECCQVSLAWKRVTVVWAPGWEKTWVVRLSQVDALTPLKVELSDGSQRKSVSGLSHHRTGQGMAFSVGISQPLTSVVYSVELRRRGMSV